MKVIKREKTVLLELKRDEAKTLYELLGRLSESIEDEMELHPHHRILAQELFDQLEEDI